eukprot:6466719-Prymnesium_polylepis.2
MLVDRPRASGSGSAGPLDSRPSGSPKPGKEARRRLGPTVAAVVASATSTLAAEAPASAVCRASPGAASLSPWSSRSHNGLDLLLMRRGLLGGDRLRGEVDCGDSIVLPRPDYCEAEGKTGGVNNPFSCMPPLQTPSSKTSAAQPGFVAHRSQGSAHRALPRALLPVEGRLADGRWWRPGAVSGDTRPC